MAAPVGIKPQDRLAWHKQLSLDRELSHAAVHVGIVISNHFNNATGETFVGLETIADEAGIARSTTCSAIKALVTRKHLTVAQGGGRSKTNSYKMALQNGPAYRTVSTPKRSEIDPLNRPTRNCSPLKSQGDWSLTLKDNSKKESDGLRISQGSKPAPVEVHTAGPRIGANGCAVFSISSPQFEAWLGYYQATGNTRRANLMRDRAERSRWGEWQEASE